MKKVLSILISFCIIMSTFTFVGITASADTEGCLTYSVSNGKATVTGYDDSISGHIIIPPTLGGYPVTSIGVSVFFDCDSLTSVSIPYGVTSIGDGAFSWCSSLTSITIPSSVTSIGDYVFFDCSSLTSIKVGENNKKYCSVDGVLFDKDKTTLIQYPIGKTSTEYIIPDSVTSIGYDAFYWCSTLTSVTIPDSVTSIGASAFSNCTSLTSANIPDSVTSIGDYAFFDCTSLTSGNIPNSVTSIGDYAFFDCTSLTSVSIGDSVTSIGVSAFSWCSSLTSVNIGDSVTSIGDRAFCCCESLTRVKIGKNVKSISQTAFDDNTKLHCDCNASVARKAIISSGKKAILEHKVKTVGKKSATYFAKGYTGDKKCSACGKVTAKGKAVAQLKLKTPKFSLKGATKKFTVKYTKVTGATGFEVRYKLGSGKYKTVKVNTKKSISKVISKLKKGKYTVQVRAFVKSGSKTAYSSWASAKKVTVK